MFQKAREALKKIYKAIYNYRIFLYIFCGILYASYIIKSVISTRSAGIFKEALIFAAVCVILTALPVHRRRFFAAEYLLELLILPIFILAMLALAAMGFAIPDSEPIGIIASAGLYAQTIYAVKSAKSGDDF